MCQIGHASQKWSYVWYVTRTLIVSGSASTWKTAWDLSFTPICGARYQEPIDFMRRVLPWCLFQFVFCKQMDENLGTLFSTIVQGLHPRRATLVSVLQWNGTPGCISTPYCLCIKLTCTGAKHSQGTGSVTILTDFEFMEGEDLKQGGSLWDLGPYIIGVLYCMRKLCGYSRLPDSQLHPVNWRAIGLWCSMHPFLLSLLMCKFNIWGSSKIRGSWVGNLCQSPIELSI